MYKVSKLAAGSVIAATAALGGASVALADGYEPRRVAYERPTDWSGVYFGVGSGYQWSSIDVAHVPGAFPTGIGITSNHDESFVSAHLGLQHGCAGHPTPLTRWHAGHCALSTGGVVARVGAELVLLRG